MGLYYLQIVIHKATNGRINSKIATYTYHIINIFTD